MSTAPPDLLTPRQAAQAIHAGYDTLKARFQEVTRRAEARFLARDWAGTQADSHARLLLYRQQVEQAVRAVRRHLGAGLQDRAVWAHVKRAYADEMRGRQDLELAETFYNSVARRVFSMVGVDPVVEYVGSRYERFSEHPLRSIYRTFVPAGAPAEMVARMLDAYPFAPHHPQWAAACAEAGARIEAAVAAQYPGEGIESVELLKPVFYRHKAAYLVGRVRTDTQAVVPLVLALLHPPEGILPDAVLLEADAASVVFSFTRSYFQVDADRPHAVVAFLKSIMPRKWIAALYIACGYDRHGKTELYRDIMSHLAASGDQFVPARGVRGMVMAVFTLPSFALVFKIIKDRFDPPKTVTHAEVRQKYRFVFLNDRVGRLMDTQEFEHMRFARDRFTPALLTELLAVAGDRVVLQGDDVIIKHLYTERRVVPLNLYLHEAPPEAQRAAVLDFGYCIKDLAAANIFPGDMFQKNFGVTRLGRVVFYDYDEMCTLDACNFLMLPTGEDPLADAPSYYVDPDDVFPEEFRRYMGLRPALLAAFEAAHGDLFTVDYWLAMQRRHAEGVLADFFPYTEAQRLH